MFRLFSVFVILIVIGIAAWGFYSFDTGEEEATKAGPRHGDIEKAGRLLVGRHIADRGFGLEVLFSGPHPDENTWTFRGSVVANGAISTAPFYATVISICRQWSKITCWRLKEIFVNGVKQQVAEPNSGLVLKTPASRPVGFEKKAGIPENQTIASIPRKVAEPIKKTPAIKPALTPATKSSWRTVNDRVNARGGPGVNHKIYFKMPTDTVLRLLRKDGKWGYFEYTGGNGSVGKVWISMQLVKVASQGK